LAIGANLYWLVWILIGLFFVVAYPVSKLLDCILGHDSGTRYRRAELKELVGIQASEDESERLSQGKPHSKVNR
jgi:metal transporter CNNM